MPNLKNLQIVIILLFTSSMVSCQGSANKKSYRSSDMYDIANPVIINLPEELDEISGIAYYPKDTSVFGIIDEDGILFKIPVLHPEQAKEWRYDTKHDFEDVVLKDSIFYALISNGSIETLRFEGDKIVTEKLAFEDASKKINEFETLYYDEEVNKMVIICKKCEEDKRKKVSAFYFDDSAKTFMPYMEIDVAPVAQKLGVEKLELKPSAAAINPVTKDLYIVCSVSKLLLITDRNGKFKDVFELNPKIYKQPEGLAFTPAGDLIISNESHLEGYGTLLVMKNKKKGK